MTVYRKKDFVDPVGEVEGDSQNGFFAIPHATMQRVGPYSTQQGAYEFLARDAGCSGFFWVDANGPITIL